MDQILNHLRQSRNAMLTMLRDFVQIESPSTEKAAVDHFGQAVAGELEASGCRVVHHRSRNTGNHLEARWRSSGNARAPRGAGPHILLLGHLDTVWPLKTLDSMPFRSTAGRAYGPGIYDMKAGIVMGIFALRCLHELKLHPPGAVTFLLNADEEIGSPSSRPLTEALARSCRAALVLEPSYGAAGALKTARKGVGEFRIRVRGISAHSGLNPEKGASAILELANQVFAIQSFNYNSRGFTFNTGVIHGGTRSNVIAAEAEAMVDVRIARRSDARWIEKKLRALRPADPRTTLEISGGINRPPFERSPHGSKLFRQARDLARGLGIALEEAAVGGGSDGNFTAALGVPTLDGLGAVGDGAHAANEHIIVAELPKRAALLAHLLLSLASRQASS